MNDPNILPNVVECGLIHPAGDFTRVPVMPEKVTTKIGDAENWWRGCQDKNRLKKGK